MQVNQQVSGSYMGNAFSGVITGKRSITVKTDGCCEFMVQLAAPMTIFGTERDSICVHAKFDGTPSSYSKFDSWMVAA